MQAIKEYKKVKSGKISLNLPKDLEGREMEILIFPYEGKKGKGSLQKLLLSGPAFRPAEITAIKQVRERNDLP